MKTLLTSLCFAVTTAYATTDGLDAYRQGLYSVAAQKLSDNTNPDPVADYYQGRLWLYGYDELKNNAMALSFFTKAAEKGYLPAQQLLARYYLIHEKSPEKALSWFKKAAEASDLPSQLYCAGAYLFGYGASKNPDVANRYLIDAAKAGNAIAQYTLAEHFLSARDLHTKKLGVIWLTKAANQGNPIAQMTLGKLYSVGQVVPKDLIKANELLTLAAQQNNPSAMIALAAEAQKAGDYTTARTWLNKATETNAVDAQVALANSLLDANNPARDEKEGFLTLLKAAQAGSLTAQQQLVSFYRQGKGIPKNDHLAKQWEETAAKNKGAQNDTPAEKAARWLSNNKSTQFSKIGYALGGIYTAWTNPVALKENNYNAFPQMPIVHRNEIYKPQFVMAKPSEIPISDYFTVLAPLLNPDYALKWSFPRYPIDKHINSVIRHESLVLSHEKGLSIIDDQAYYLEEPQQEKAFDYFGEKIRDLDHQANLQAVLSDLYGQAILGVPSAQFQIGQLYQYGIGVEKNIDQALIYYQLAATQQDVRAEYNLGLLYLEGKTNPVDYPLGIRWLTTAAFKGNAYAQYVLANLYENGLKDSAGNEVVQPNHEQAIAMYYLASSSHYGEAQYKLANFLVKDSGGDLSVGATKNRIALIKRLYADAAKHGVAEAVLPLAFYNAMDPDPKKQAQALYVAKKESEEGNPEAALLLGIMLERGIGTTSNPKEAIAWYQKASLNPISAFILGTYYSEGKISDKTPIKGRELLQQSAQAGFSYADFNLAILKHNSNEQFLSELNQAKEKGNAKAGLLLADYYLSQADNPDNLAQARAIYHHFAEKGDKNAQVKLGFLYEQGLGGEINKDIAAQWYNLSAEQGQPIAQYLLGHLYQLGQIGNLQPDYQQAKKWYKAALSNYPYAAVALGFLFDTVDDDYASSLENYTVAAVANNPQAQYNLGLIYEYGKGRPVDLKKAGEWYIKAALQGNSHAMTQVASLFFQAGNNQEALNWYQKAAQLKEPGALYQMGLFHETGLGLPANYQKAADYYQEAATLGNEKAKLALARMLQYGLGLPKDIERAAGLYKELANNHYPYAQYQLALLYVSGQLGEQMISQGKALLQEASKNGNRSAEKTLSRLSCGQEKQGSFIESISFNQPALLRQQSAELMYFDALNAWNRGDETLSKQILHQLIAKYPNYLPGKKAFELL